MIPIVLTNSIFIMELQVPQSVRGMLGQASLFFREEDVAAGDVLTVGGGAASSRSSSEKLYFIGSGSVELQVCYAFAVALSTLLATLRCVISCVVVLCPQSLHISRMGSRHGYRVCWMSAGRNNGLMQRCAHTYGWFLCLLFVLCCVPSYVWVHAASALSV